MRFVIGYMLACIAGAYTFAATLTLVIASTSILSEGGSIEDGLNFLVLSLLSATAFLPLLFVTAAPYVALVFLLFRLWIKINNAKLFFLGALCPAGGCFILAWYMSLSEGGLVSTGADNLTFWIGLIGIPAGLAGTYVFKRIVLGRNFETWSIKAMDTLPRVSGKSE